LTQNSHRNTVLETVSREDWMELTLDAEPFNLDFTLSCGQVFRWNKVGDWWYGVVGENVLKVKKSKDKLIFDSYPEKVNAEFIRMYFRLDDNLPHIVSQINKDELMAEAIKQLYGLRIIRQDPWECLISYICATNANIPFIKNMIQTLSRNHGRRIVFENQDFYIFPKPEVLAKAVTDKLSLDNMGYRTRYIIETSKAISSHTFDLYVVRSLDYREGKELLLSRAKGKKLLLGVGPKAADCVLLFSLEKTQAFPVDVWILRIVLDYYSKLFDTPFVGGLKRKLSAGSSITNKQYEMICDTMQQYFGKYAGYAQEYLFHFRRSAIVSMNKQRISMRATVASLPNAFLTYWKHNNAISNQLEMKTWRR